MAEPLWLQDPWSHCSWLAWCFPFSLHLGNRAREKIKGYTVIDAYSREDTLYLRGLDKGKILNKIMIIPFKWLDVTRSLWINPEQSLFLTLTDAAFFLSWGSGYLCGLRNSQSIACKWKDDVFLGQKVWGVTVSLLIHCFASLWCIQLNDSFSSPYRLLNIVHTDSICSHI